LTSTPKRNMYGSKILLCIWDIKGVVYYELLKLNQTVAAELSITINQFKSCFKSETFNNSSKKTQSDFVARQYVAKVVKCMLSALQWKILLHAAYSSDCTSSDHHLFLPALQNIWRNKKKARWMNASKDKFFLSRNSLIVRKVRKSYS